MNRVIKQDGSARAAPVGRLAALNVANFAEQAQRMILEARAQATEMLDRAREKAALVAAETQVQAEVLRRQAHDQGLAAGSEEGYAKGLAQGQADGAEKAFQEAMSLFNRQTEDLRKLLSQSVSRLDEAREQVLRQARADLLELSLTIAERITGVRARGDIETAQTNLAKAIEMVACRSQVQIRVCPAQLNQLTEYAKGFLEGMGMSESTSFLADESLAPGDVVLQSRNGQVDARVQTQLSNIIKAITGREEAVA
jgi:flagellar assembly protein FliH